MPCCLALQDGLCPPLLPDVGTDGCCCCPAFPVVDTAALALACRPCPSVLLITYLAAVWFVCCIFPVNAPPLAPCLTRSACRLIPHLLPCLALPPPARLPYPTRLPRDLFVETDPCWWFGWLPPPYTFPCGGVGPAPALLPFTLVCCCRAVLTLVEHYHRPACLTR